MSIARASRYKKSLELNYISNVINQLFFQSKNSFFLNIVLLFILGIFLLPGNPAFASFDLCEEDGGTAVCTEPEAGPYTYSYSVPHMQLPFPNDCGGTASEGAMADCLIEETTALHNLCSANIRIPPWLPLPEGSASGVININDPIGGDYVLGFDLSTETSQRKVDTEFDGYFPTDCSLYTWEQLQFFRLRTVECPVGFGINSATQPSRAYCYRLQNEPDPDKNLACPVGSGMRGSSTNTGTGNKYHNETDFNSTGIGDLEFQRHYNSSRHKSIRNWATHRLTKMGSNWSTNFDRLIVPPQSTYIPTAHAYRPDGNVYRFKKQPNGEFASDSDVTDRLEPILDTAGNAIGWLYYNSDNSIEHYDAFGELTVLESADGFQTTLEYTDGQLTRAIDPQGRELTFTYNTSGWIDSVDTPDGLLSYTYDANDNLTSITYPDNSVKIYHYEDSNNPFSLTGITDERGHRYSTFTYDLDGRVIISEHSGGADRTEFNYINDEVTVVTHPLGYEEIVATNLIKGVRRHVSSSGPGCSTCGDNASTTTYDSNGFKDVVTDFNGNITDYDHNPQGLETRRIEAVGSSVERTITTHWHPDFRLPIEINQPNKRNINYTYNNRRQILTSTETDISGNISRTSSYNYCEAADVANATSTGCPIIGLLKSVDGPRTDVADITTYRYYTTDTTDYRIGDLHTITNALGQVTEHLKYDAAGRALEISDTNNILTTLTYHQRGWPTSITKAALTTSIQYDENGQLSRITQPNGAFINAEYDNAHRLTTITDNLGNRIEYVLDAAGNRTLESTKDSTGLLKQQVQRVFNDLSRMTQLTDGVNNSIDYLYDSQGNNTSITDSLGDEAQFQFDALNRVMQMVDAALGNVSYDYDGRDNLTKVTDQRGLETAYKVNGLNNNEELDSPETGLTRYTFDDAGNRISKTDARNVTVQYEYDALNRLTLIDYPGISLDTHLEYDDGPFGKGKLTRMIDASGATIYSYDQIGNLISETRTIGNSSFTIAYNFDSSNQLQSITYPSGQVIEHQFDAFGRIKDITRINQSSSENIVSNVTYNPFGQANGWLFGNGITASRNYDLAYRIDEVLHGSLLQQDFDYYPTGNISNITNILDATSSQTFNYDSMYRLTSANGVYGSQSFQYDAVGNRLELIANTQSTSYDYASDANRLVSINGMSIVMDAVGNTLQDANHSYAYDSRNRMFLMDNGQAQYEYNGFGERVKKDHNGKVTYFVYNQQGNLLGEYTADGTAIREYIILNGSPVAVIDFAEASMPPLEYIVDEESAVATGNWREIVSLSSQAYQQDFYFSPGDRGYVLRWNVQPAAGEYLTYFMWPLGYAASSVDYKISHNGLIDISTQDQNNNAGQWNYAGTYFFSGTGNEYIEIDDSSGRTSADAIRLLEANPSQSVSTTVHYVHTDHLGTPRVVSDDQGSAIWQWDSEPFGNGAPDQDADGDGISYIFNLRLPGQYYDAESGQHYNYFRDYDPSIGRYTQSDPIGLSGGLNTYIYSGANPVNNSDPSGLRFDSKVFERLCHISGTCPDDTTNFECSCSPIASAANYTINGETGEVTRTLLPNFGFNLECCCEEDSDCNSSKENISIGFRAFGISISSDAGKVRQKVCFTVGITAGYPLDKETSKDFK